MASEQEMAAWVTRVLGVEIPARNGASGPLLPIWASAKDNVDAQLGTLTSVLRRIDIPVLHKVADKMEDVLGGFRVALVARLMEYDAAVRQGQASARATARQAALRTVADYRTRIPNDPHIVGADTNPFGVTVAIRATMDKALDRLQRQLATG